MSKILVKNLGPLVFLVLQKKEKTREIVRLSQSNCKINLNTKAKN